MPTNDGFTPDHPLPVFLSGHAEEPEPPCIGKASDGAIVSSRILKTGLLVVTATAIGILLVENPVGLVTDVTASLMDIVPLRPGTDQSTPTIPSTADAQALPPTASDAPRREEIAGAFEPAGQSRTEASQPPAEALLEQFKAWAAEEDARAQVAEPVQDARARVVPVQPIQDAPAPVVQNAPPQVSEDARVPVRHVRMHRRVRSVQDARAEIRPRRDHRASVRREQNSRLQVRPGQDARAQNQSVENAQAPSLLQSLGLHN